MFIFISCCRLCCLSRIRKIFRKSHEVLKISYNAKATLINYSIVYLLLCWGYQYIFRHETWCLRIWNSNKLKQIIVQYLINNFWFHAHQKRFVPLRKWLHFIVFPANFSDVFLICKFSSFPFDLSHCAICTSEGLTAR